MATKYWVGNGGNWSDTTHWSLSSGGAGGASEPTSSDDTKFNAASFSIAAQTVTVTAGAVCKSIDFTGAINSPTISLAANLTVSGNVTLVSGITVSGTEIFQIDGTCSLTTNGVAFGCFWLEVLTGGTVTLADNLTATNISISAGSFDSNTKTITAEDMEIYSTTVLDRSTITISGGYVYFGFFDGAAVSAIGTSINVGAGGWIEIYDWSLTGLQATITGSAASKCTFTLDSSVTVGQIDNTTFTNVTVTGPTFNAADPTNIDNGGNSGINFGQDRYWVFNTGNVGVTALFHTTSFWSMTSGGTTGASVPTTGETAIFDANSGIGTRNVVEVRDVVLCHLSFVGITDSYLHLILDDSSASLSLQGSLSGLPFLCIYSGTFTTNNYSVSTTMGLVFGLSGYTAPTVSLGSSVLTIGDGASGGIFFRVNSGYTTDFSGTTVIVNISTPPGDYSYFEAYSQTFGTVEINFLDNELCKFDGSNTFDSLTISGNGTLSFNEFIADTTQTITTSLAIDGTSSGGLTLNSLDSANWSISKASGALYATNCTIENSTATGGATFYALTSSGGVDGGGNAGWLFEQAVVYAPAVGTYNEGDHITHAPGDSGGTAVWREAGTSSTPITDIHRPGCGYWFKETGTVYGGEVGPWVPWNVDQKVEFNEGSKIVKSPTVSGGTPIWEVGKTGPAITDTHVPCGYWFKDYDSDSQLRRICFGLEMGYTKTDMVVDEQQTLYVKDSNGDTVACPITVWTLSGVGSLSESVGPTTVYTAPSYSEAGSDSATITLWCGGAVKDTLVISVAHSCDCLDIIEYTSLQMSVSQQQTLSASGAQSDECYSWQITSGGGSLSAATGKSVVYTAPSSNANCASNPTITLTCGGATTDTLEIAVRANSFDYNKAAYYVTQGGGHGTRIGDPANPAFILRDCEYGIYLVPVRCDGSIPRTWDMPHCGSDYANPYSGSCPHCAVLYYDPPGCWGNWAFDRVTDMAHAEAMCASAAPKNTDFPRYYGIPCNCAIGAVYDVRTAQQKADGCCPAGLL